MNKFFSFIFSMFFTIILLMIFAISIAYATIIENDYGTSTAQILIYQAWWFELLLFVGLINLCGSVFKYKLVNRKKWAVLLFHLSFIVIIIGAAVTRYIGFEGSLHIREGEASNKVVSESSIIQVVVSKDGNEAVYNFNKKFNPNADNTFKETIDFEGTSITVENEIFVPSASENLVADKQGGAVISLIYTDNESQRTDFLLENQQSRFFTNASFSFETEKTESTFNFKKVGAEIYFACKDSVTVNSATAEKVAPNTLIPLKTNVLYSTSNSGFAARAYLQNGTSSLVYIPNEAESNGIDAFTAKITLGATVRKLNIFGKEGVIYFPTACVIDGYEIKVSYGAYVYNLPFEIYLRDFQLERYAGSMSPSSYASEITLKDTEKGIERQSRIFMNNILNYRGYRFFQSSYDKDEKGTILSVNKDYWGTLITYFGYFIMILGMIFTVISKNSRFQQLVRLSKKLQTSRQLMKILITGIILGSLLLNSNSSLAANESSAKKTHIKSFGKLLVQDHKGRIEPINTLATDVLLKISRKNTFQGISATEVLLEMHTNPVKWQNIPIIKISNTELLKTLGLPAGLVTFNQMFNQKGQYILNELVQNSYNKKQTLRNKFDKEIINVDERVNILYQIFNGDFLRIFPIPGDENKTWVTQDNFPDNSAKAEKDFVSNIQGLYFDEYNKSVNSKIFSKTDEYLSYIKKFQVNNGGELIPSQSKINMEVLYNDWNIFGKLSKIYGLVGFILLIIQFTLIFKPSLKLPKLNLIGTSLVFILFLLYTSGIAARWYISDHAPWSNGYETMIFIGWATSLSGFIFAKRSPISLAVTTLLTSIILFVASMSWMNPEITNLVPVLKSYWLIVHVAVITASYGFFGMGALLGLLNLVLMIIRYRQNDKNIKFTIIEVSYIIEMALIIGLLLLTIGSFLGGVWANESWGRYWGWDPKETWALVTILVYTIVLHLRKVPGLKSIFAISSLSLVGLASVLMTFFGVNYYLSGMHSYAQGDPPPIPAALYISVVALILIIVTAYYSEQKFGKIESKDDSE